MRLASTSTYPDGRRRSAAARIMAILLAGALLALLLTSAALAAGFAVTKTGEFVADANGDGLYGAGDTLLYTVSISNSSSVTLEQVILTDTVPLDTAYVTNTTEFDDGGGAVPIPDSASDTPFPLDDGVVLGDLPVNGVFTVTYQVVVDDPYLGATGIVTNVAHVTALSETVSAEAGTPIEMRAIDIEKVASAAFVTATTPVTYTYTVRNPGTRPLGDISVTDDRCTPVVYIGGDTNTDTVLTPDEAWTYACTAEIEFATLNTAVVTGMDSLGKTVQDSDTAFVDSTHLYFPILFAYTPPEACPPPDGCPLEGRIKGMDVHEGTGALYVAASDAQGTTDQLLKVDTYTFEIVDRVDTGSEPWGVVVNETTNRIYVSNYGSGTVSVFDATTLDPLGAPIPVGDNPGRMAILEALDTVFVVVRGGSKVAVIEGLGPAKLIGAGGSGPWGIAADPVRNYVFVSHADSVSFSLLRRVNGDWVAQPGTGKLEDRTRLFGLAYNTANGKLYAPYADKEGQWFVEIWEPHALSPWGRVTHTPVPDGGALGDPNVGGGGIIVNPATGNVFNANTGADSVSVIDRDSNGALATLAVMDDPFPAAVDSKLNTVYIGLRAPGRVVKIEDTY